MNYAEYQAQKKTYSDKDKVKIDYISNFLKKDGDSVVVRFPYHSMDDLEFTNVHNVQWPGAPFGKEIICEDTNCPFCAQKEKISTRVFLKMLLYTISDTGTIVKHNAVWDRPAAFADNDINALFKEYGDISQQLFKITRTGKDKQTRYALNIIINKLVYPDDKYVVDFSELNTINAARVCAKSIKQYNKDVLGIDDATTVTTAVPTSDDSDLPFDFTPTNSTELATNVDTTTTAGTNATVDSANSTTTTTFDAGRAQKPSGRYGF